MKNFHRKKRHKHCVSCKRLDFSMFLRARYILWRSRGCTCPLSGLGCIRCCGGLRGLIRLAGCSVFYFWRCIFLWSGLPCLRCGRLRCFSSGWERIWREGIMMRRRRFLRRRCGVSVAAAQSV